MQPLTPKDLLLRPKNEEGNESTAITNPPVSLERFQVLERTIRDIPLYIDSYLELAEIYSKVGRWADARRVLEIAVTRFPDDVNAASLYEDAQLARSKELVTKAEEEYRAEPTELSQENVRRCLMEFNVLRERVYRARMQRDPARLELMIPLADALDRLGQNAEAINCLKEASEQPNLRAEASLQLGRMLERAQRVPEALSAYRRAAFFRVPPPSSETKYAALFAAADLALRSGMIDSGRRYLRMVLEIAPNNPALSQRLAELESLPL